MHMDQKHLPQPTSPQTTLAPEVGLEYKYLILWVT